MQKVSMWQSIPLHRILDTASLRLAEDQTITDALIQTTRSGVRSLLVNWQHQWFALSQKTIKVLVEQGKGSLKLRDILVSIPPYKSDDFVNIWELLRLMRSYRVDCLTVVDREGETIGVVMLTDVLQFLEKVARPQVAGGWYEYITDTTAEGIFIVDLDLTLLFVNTRLSNLLGYEIGAMEGKNLKEFLVISEENEEQVECERHFRFKAKDGTDVWAIVVVTPLFDGEGHNIGTLGRISNITEKITQQRKEKRQLSALEAATEGIAILNNRGEFIYANPSFCQLFDKTAQELITTDWWTIYGNYRRAPLEIELQQQGKWQGNFCWHDRYLDVSLTLGEEDIICICRDFTDRYQAQQALQASEERYRLLAEYAIDVIARCSVQGRYVYLSPACKEVLGYTPDELINHVFFDYIHPEDSIRVHLAYQVMIESLDANRFVYRFCRKDGSYVWIETTAKVKRYPDTNSPMEIITVSREVTETIEAEMELTRSQGSLKLALEATNDGLWEWHISTGEIHCSDRCWTMMGYDRSTFTLHFDNWLDILHPADRERVLAALNQHLNRETDKYKTEFRMRQPEGNYKWVLAQGRVVERDQAGNPLRMIGALTDIDQRKRMEETLQKQYQRALILEQITSQIRSSLEIESVLVRTVQELSKAFHQSCLIANFSYDQTIVYPSDDRIAQIDVKLLPPSFLAQDEVTIVKPELLNVSCCTDVAIVRTSYQDKCNGLILLCSDQNLFHWHKEDIELLEAVAQQVGIAIAQAELLREAQVQSELAQVANRTKSSFLAMMSHEIRTPLNGIIGMAELLNQSEINAQQQELVQTIVQSSRALLTILNDILDFSKIEAGQLTLDEQPFNLPQVVEEAVSAIAPLGYEKGVELIYDFDLSLPTTIEGDGNRLRQVLLNLLSNAVKFCPKGEIWIEVSPYQGEKVLFMIGETGIGIDPARMGDLFCPFSQLDPSHTRSYGGTGLGLAICKFLVDRMGGQIWCESNHHIGGQPPAGWSYYRSVEQGTTFYVALPLRGSVDHPPPLPPLTKRILVLTPNQQLGTVLHRWLTAWGMEVVVESQIGTHLEGFDGILVDDLFSIEEIMGCVAKVDCPVILLQKPGNPPFPCVRTLTKPLKPHPCRQLLEFLFMEQSPSPPVVAPQPLPPLSVLLVEDNPVNQKVAQRLLQKLGLTPTLAANGLEALDRLRAHNYDVVLMDIQMPEMDGLTATTKIRTECSHQPYIIAMTANAMRDDREVCLEAGMNDYLSKPISLASLEQALQKAVALK